MLEFNDTQKMIYGILKELEKKDDDEKDGISATELQKIIKSRTGREITRQGMRQLIDRMNGSDWFHESWQRIKIDSTRGRGNIARYKLIS